MRTKFLRSDKWYNIRICFRKYDVTRINSFRLCRCGVSTEQLCFKKLKPLFTVHNFICFCGMLKLTSRASNVYERFLRSYSSAYVALRIEVGILWFYIATLGILTVLTGVITMSGRFKKLESDETFILHELCILMAKNTHIQFNTTRNHIESDFVRD